VLPKIDFARLSFGDPRYLWLLVVPALLFLLLAWRVGARRSERARMHRGRVLPLRERLTFAGDLPFWFCVLLALSLVIIALARPQGPATVIRQGGLDLVILADGSASMRVKDVSGDRWKRSMRFVRLLGDSLSWKNDRIALALFAHIAAPQIRLTSDPNTFFFFLDHLDDEPPFRIEDETTWDTNLELGIYWGLRVMERDEDVRGKSPNAQMFVLLTDGEAWSGEVANAIRLTRQRGVPVHVVGVGTLSGGAMPLFPAPPDTFVDDSETPKSSRLDRPSLQRVAATSGGQYFELDRDGDRFIANSIIQLGRRQAPALDTTEEAEELYWYFLVTAATIYGLGLVSVRERRPLWILTGGTAVVLAWLSAILR
jgi:Ca-activated chloride channel homolog